MRRRQITRGARRVILPGSHFKTDKGEDKILLKWLRGKRDNHERMALA